MAKLTDDEAREIEEGIPNLRGPILLTWIRRLLEDRRDRIAEARDAEGRSQTLTVRVSEQSRL